MKLTFDEIYPNAKYLNQQKCDGDEVVHSEKKGKCCQCGQLTFWVSISFHSYTCSLECNQALWAEYFSALKR